MLKKKSEITSYISLQRFMCHFLYKQVNSAVYSVYSHRLQAPVATVVCLHVHVGLHVVVVVECQPHTKRLH